MKAKKNKTLWIVLIALSLVLLVEAAWLAFKLIGESKPADEMKIQTPYCTLYFPGEWEGQIYIEQAPGEPFVVSFYGKIAGHTNQRLFDVKFSEQPMTDMLGTVTGNDGKMRCVSIMLHPFVPDATWSDADQNAIFAMQDDINYLIDKLPLARNEQVMPEQTDATQPELTQPQVYEKVVVTTPFATLYYPGDWSEYLQIEHLEGEKYTVNFYASIDSHQRTLLFAISFGEVDAEAAWVRVLDDGSVVGVNVEFYTPEFSGWSEEQKNLALVMQEAGNELVHQLALQEREQSPEEETEPELTEDPSDTTESDETVTQEGDIIVETPYGQLKYPQKWHEQTRIVQASSAPLSVSFYAKIGEHEEQLLFSVLFDTNKGAVIGTVADSKGNLVTVSIILGTLDETIEWTDTERENYYSMQDDVNYLIESLALQ